MPTTTGCLQRLDACNDARRLKTRRGLAPYEFIHSPPQDSINRKALPVGDTGFQESFTDVLHISLLGVMQSRDK